ncbi:diguanylate cyclase/phosphodiesterase with PAS/PAC sensor [Burkholderiales bacterium GJ-E10]|nr:diguanylate cyclase/phosphodiesterase with PAS/PAC sensor [Burkholderiales bacterium GJ-E10]
MATATPALVNTDHVLPVLYDLLLTIGGETKLRPLLARVLQRLLYHTSFPVGIAFLDLTHPPDGSMAHEGRIAAVVGDFRLREREGQALRIPPAMMRDDVVREEDGAALLAELGLPRYRSFLALPLNGTGLLLLLAPVIPETRLPLASMFRPVLAHLTNAVRLCRERETRTANLIAANVNLEAQRHLLSSVYDSMQIGVLISDASGIIVAVNPAFTRISGYAGDEVIGANPRILSSGRQDPAFYAAFWRSLTQQGYWQGEIWNRRKNGQLCAEWLSITRVRHERSGEVHYVAIYSDITERKEAQQRIDHLAHYDQLTGLPNRTLLYDRFQRAAAYAVRHDEQMAMLFVDLDNFKYINDVFGHSVGDALLAEVSRRLRDMLRETDILSRLGGDEFVAILTEVHNADAVTTVTEELVRALHQPFQIDGHTFHTGSSIGISLYPGDGTDFDTLLRHADMAMYHAKAAGRDTFRFFTQSMNRALVKRLDLEQRLRAALSECGFRLHFQPQIRLSDRGVESIEALLRWPVNGEHMIPPNEFIPVAEESGLIVPLGKWVLREACRCAQRWRQAQGRDIPVAVNLSAVQLRRGDIVETVRTALAQSGLPANCLELELTESMFIRDAERMETVARELKEMGVRLALDDFGTGCSNMASLKRMQFDKLKIDRSFVREIADSAESAAIVRAIVEIGRSLRLLVTAEGVETQDQADFLHGIGCDFAQGYLFFRPLPEQGLSVLLTESGRSLH